MKKLTVVNRIGRIGEEAVVKFLMKQGFDVFCRNYLEKSGEIDVVAIKGYTLHFIEVKSVTRKTFIPKNTHQHRPEELFHSIKRRRMLKTAELFLNKQKQAVEKMYFRKIENLSIDLAIVQVSLIEKRAQVRFFENV